MKFKQAYTGTHGTGKSTATYLAAYNFKMECPNKIIEVLVDVERKNPFPINKESKKESQIWIFLQQFLQETTLMSKCDILICDRTVMDVLAYSEVLGINDIVRTFLNVAIEHLKTYDKIYLKSYSKNNYIADDGQRSIDLKFRHDVEYALLNFYNYAGTKIDNWNSKFEII